MSELKWYVLKSVSGQESKVKNYIENEMKRLGFESYVTQVVIPMEKVIMMRNGKKVPKERPYYPGYLMVEANLVGEIPHIIKNIPGVNIKVALNTTATQDIVSITHDHGHGHGNGNNAGGGNGDGTAY